MPAARVQAVNNLMVLIWQERGAGSLRHEG